MLANPLVVDTGTPPIPEARAWLDAYDGRHGVPINLSQAAPGVPPPRALLDRLAAAAGDPGFATYGPILGEDALRSSLAAEWSRAPGGPVSAADIAITIGCNQAFAVAILAIARAGDAVVLPEPWYFNHAMTLQMLGIRVVPLPCRAEAGFVPDVSVLCAALATSRAKAVVLVTPNNPTGAIYPPEVIAGLVEAAQAGGAWTILDETYRDFLPAADARPHDLLADPAARNATIQLYSFSKSYAVPGHRLGALRAPPSLMPEIEKVLDCWQICAPRAAQAAIAWAVEGLAAWREANRADIVARAAAFRQALADRPGWRIDALGAYFAYVAHPFARHDARRIAQRLAHDVGVLVLPGTYFGGPTQAGHLRLAFANTDTDGIRDAVRRLGLMSV